MTKIPLGPYIPHRYGDEVERILKSHRGWVIANIHHSIPWPINDVLISYNLNEYVLSGIREQNGMLLPPCIKIKLSKYPSDNEDDIHSALKNIYQFTSILGWFLGGYVDVVGFISGSHPIHYGAMNQLFAPCTTSHFNCDRMPIISDEKTRKALAFWREGLKLKLLHEGYSFLSFYKVIESQYDRKCGNTRGEWINKAICQLSGNAADRIKELLNSGFNDLGKYIYQSGRCAVAHASDSSIIDPDLPKDKIRISSDLIVIQKLAEKYIEEVLGVPTEKNKWLSLQI